MSILFFSWLELSEEWVAAAYKTFIQDKKDGMIVRVIGGGQWEEVDGLRPIYLFIGNTCKKMPVTGGNSQESECVNVMWLDDGTRDPSNAMFCEDFSRSSGWTFFDEMTENSIATEDGMEFTWEPI